MRYGTYLAVACAAALTVFLRKNAKKGRYALAVDAAKLLMRKGIFKGVGAKRLVVIADFDRTLSRFRTRKGGQSTSTHGVIENFHKLGSDYVREANALKDHYLPLENKVSLSIEDRTKVCEEWWTKAHELLIRYRLSRKDVQEAVASNRNLELRDGALDFFSILKENDIPLLIFSAGLGDVIDNFLSMKIFRGKIPSNVTILSNKMVFSGAGPDARLVGFDSDIIHSCNKGAVALKTNPSAPDLCGRDTVVLLGDSLGDVHMADSLIECGKVSTVLKVGYLNSNVPENRSRYNKIYDKVICNDGSLYFPKALVEALI
eukprot:g189.t1